MSGARSRSADGNRQNELAAIHVGKAQLSLDDDTYRDMLARVSSAHGASCRSARDLTPRQRSAVLDELRRLGAGKVTRPKNHGRPANIDQMPLMITKIEALLADMGLPWSYADAICKQQCGVEKVSWCRKESALRAVIAALDVEHKKRAQGRHVDELLQHWGFAEEEMIERLRAAGQRMPINWRRSLKCLGIAAEWISREIEAHLR